MCYLCRWCLFLSSICCISLTPPTQQLFLTSILLTTLLQLSTSFPSGPQKLHISPSEHIADNSEQNPFRRTIRASKENVNVLNKAISVVEDLLSQNSSLPRLTKGEIVEIIENITKADIAEYEKTHPNKTRAKDQRALMVVLPYTAPSLDQQKIEELYTRPPITHIVGDEDEDNSKPHRRRRPTLPPIPQEHHNLKEQKKRKRKPQIQTTTQFSDNPEIVTKISVVEGTTVSSNVEQEHKIKYSKVHRKRIPSKHAQRYPNHKYPGDGSTTTTVEPKINLGQEFFSNPGIKIIDAPKLMTPTTYHPPMETTFDETLTVKPLPIIENIPEFRPVFNSIQTPRPIIDDLSVPEDLKAAFDTLDIPTIKTTKKPLRKEPTTGSTTQKSVMDIKNIADSLTPDMKELLMSFGLLPDPNSTPNPIVSTDLPLERNPAPIPAESYIQFKPLPDDGPAREEMNEFLARFGLGRNSRNSKNDKGVQNITNAPSTESTLNDVPYFEIAMIPDSMKDVLSDIGLTDRQGKAIRAESLTKTLSKNGEIEKQHIFKPTEATYATDEELQKLNRLLDVIKQLEKLNGSVSEEEIRKKVNLDEIKKLVANISQEEFVSLDEQESGPNPINFDYGVIRNEFKRQENSSVDTVTTEATATEAASISTEASTSNIKALEDSFGGPAETVTETLPPTSTTIRTGFYYLLDWNTFLDIDDQKGRRVNLRFEPKVGDPKRFLAVNVP